MGLLAEMADEQGVQLLVENLPYPTGGKVPLYTNEQYAEFFRQYPRHKSIIDVGHAHMNGMDIPAFLQEHGDRSWRTISTTTTACGTSTTTSLTGRSPTRISHRSTAAIPPGLHRHGV